MTRMKKFIYGFVTIYLVSVTAWIVFLYQLFNPGPYAYAAIDPIPGAEVIYHHVRYRNALGGATEVWVLQVPKEYYEKLYKDCAAIHYLPGPYLNPANQDVSVGTGVEKYLDPKAPSCHDADGDHLATYISEFRGDKLIVYFDHGLL